MAVSAPQSTLTTELRRMVGRPFGIDTEGNPIDHGSGKLIVGAIEAMQAIVAERAEREAGAMAPEKRKTYVEAMQSAALDSLVGMLNGAIPDERYHLTREYLLQESNLYSYEFRLFVAEYCRIISGDPDFMFHMGKQSIPPAMRYLARPLGVRGTYAVLPKFAAKYVKTDFRIAETTSTSAIIRWYGASQLEHLPPEHRLAYIRYACRTYQGACSAIPRALFDQPEARIREIACQADGAEYCEWEFTWDAERSSALVPALAGVAGGLAVLAYGLVRLPGARTVERIAAALLPAAVMRERAVRQERHRLQEMLAEERDLTEKQYDLSERVNAELQQTNMELTRRIAELSMLQEISSALSATLDLDDLLDESLRAVVDHLKFDRALVMLLDEERQALVDARSVGVSRDAVRVMEQLVVPLDGPSNPLLRTFHADHTLLFADVDRSSHEASRAVAAALGVQSFLATPLISKGRRLGVLGVDNSATGRDVDLSDAALLFTIGNQIATAIENARLYREIEEYSRNLEQRVEQRTRELAKATAEADEARAAAVAANEAKSAFLASVSHELRTPLTSILGFTKIIRKRLDEVVLPRVDTSDLKVRRAVRQVSDNLDIIILEGERLTNMINDVLDLAKIESGKIEWRMELVSPVDIVTRAITATASLFEQKGLETIVDVPEDLPAIVGDENRLIQVVINLLSNAVKFTDSGSVTCGAKCEADELIVSVIDTGAGIAPEDHGKIFEEFRQVGDTLTDKPKGTGLGLPICKHIVEAHGGRIWIESASGTGSAFRFTVPISASGTMPGRGPDDIDISISTRPGEPQVVLIVEDDARIRELLRQSLEAGGFEVWQASDGEEALRTVQQHQPDLIILDVIMPGASGFDVASTLKGDVATGRIPIIMLTVVDDPEGARRAGVDRYFTKPFDSESILREVQGLLAASARLSID